MMATPKCDVYSFGVVALEVMMGTHPGDLITSLSSPDSLHTLLVHALDGRLPPPTGQVASAVVLAVAAALACVNENPESRPTMQRVARRLSDLRLPRHSVPLRSIRLLQLLDGKF